jgi:hypothetical protein
MVIRGFPVKKFSPQRTRRARRKENLTAKERQGFSFVAVTVPRVPLPGAGVNEVLIQISETFVSFVIFVVTEINVTVPG